MFKLFVGFVIGCATTYLYFNPGDVDGMIDAAQTAIHDGASYVKDKTE